MPQEAIDQRILVEPDYGQFYLRRGGHDDWHSGDVPFLGYERRLWSSGTFVVVLTDRKYGTTSVQVQVVGDVPTAAPAPQWQHVVEDSLVAGGDLEIFNWGGHEPVANVPLPSGPVRLRVAWSGLVENRFEGLDEDGNSDEHLLIQVWPQEPADPAVLRWWGEWDLPAPSPSSVDGRRQIEGLEPVLEALASLELVHRCPHPYPHLPGSTEAHNSTVAIYQDQREGSWWADGYDVRRTLREITDQEVVRLRR